MMDIVVIADDLTGALDTGVQFIKKGIITMVITNLEFDLKNIPDNIEALVIDTESRHLLGEQAKTRIKNILSKFKNHPIRYYYKKIDSTFRGNVGKELEGFIEGTGTKILSFVPAFPDNARKVKDGILYVNDERITQTSFAKDILNPIKNDYIPDILKENFSYKIERIEGLNIQNLSFKDKKIILFDSETKNDLINIGEKLKHENLLKYSAGSAGFAEIIAEFEKRNNLFKKSSFKNDKILFISGSVNPISLEQNEYAKQNGYVTYDFKFEKIICKNFDFQELVNKIDFNKNKKILLRTFSKNHNMEDNLNYLKERKLEINEIALNITQNIGILTKNIIYKYNIETIIVFGGDTLIGILKALKCFYIIPLVEIISGVVLSEIEYDNKRIKIITKAGGFGKVDIIKTIENYKGIR